MARRRRRSSSLVLMWPCKRSDFRWLVLMAQDLLLLAVASAEKGLQGTGVVEHRT